MTTGHDVGSKRLDDLDRIVLRESLAEPMEQRIFCNMGSGESKLSDSLAVLGHRVYNYDIRDLGLFFDLLKERGYKQYFTNIDITDIKMHHLPKQYDGLIFQRVLHYCNYKQCRQLLLLVLKGLTAGGKMYLSFSGLESEIGATYSAAHEPIESRWGSIDADAQVKFSIDQELCLYSQSDVEQLVESIDGLKIETIWQSEFGNIKCVLVAC